MKITIVALAAFLSFTWAGAPLARAARHSHESDDSDSSITWGLGISTTDFIPTTGGGVGVSIGISDRAAIEGLFGFSYSSNNTVGMGFGGVFKYTAVGGPAAGFHVGAGLGFGAISGQFAFSVPVLIGFHFEIPGVKQIQVHFDAGPTFALVTTAGSPIVGFSMAPASTMLGMSVFYNF